ncbi:MAG TPA: hydroxymethylglutaryl-CoA lyase [Terracidiphilus sp.]|jgi:hydroxymethylglutaryl-CoA lyase|nr:hydroxymethylglutaryl-CoA lyase [Terracidiphilus sp.]
MDDSVKIIECPRDAWQGLARPIPAESKAEYLRSLIATGFRHIDAVSFVSPAAIPQMADSELVLEHLMPPESVEIIGIVVNAKGAERAIRTGAVQTLGFPYSISPEFLRRNQNQTLEQSIDTLDAVIALAQNAGLDVVAYLSMAFGNPYGDPWSVDEVVNACDLLAESGIQQVSLADTVGLATPSHISETLSAVLPVFDHIEFGAHLHARPTEAAARIRAAYQAGCRRFDAAIGGFGGCPFAQDVLVGNIATEDLIRVLDECGATLPPIGPLAQLSTASAKIAHDFGAAVQ